MKNHDLPNIDPKQFSAPASDSVFAEPPSSHPPRILLLYGSLRERSFSRLAVEEAARLLEAMGAETRIFSPRGLPLADAEEASHSKVQELVKFTLLIRDRSDYLTDRYSERVESAEEVSKRVNQRSM